MRLTVNRAALRLALDVAAGIANRKKTMPILANVLLAVNGGVIKVTATDLQIAYAVTIPCASDGAATLALPAKTLLDAISSLSSAEVELRAEGLNAELRAGKSRFTLPGVDPKDFPNQMDVTKLKFTEIAMADLRLLMGRVSFASDPNTNSQGLQGIFIDLAAGVAMASDGHQCSVARSETKAVGLPKIQAPKEGVRHLLKAFHGVESVHLAVGPSELYARSEGALFGVKLHALAFPERALLDGILRTKSEFTATVSREAFEQAVKRVALLSVGENGLPIDFEIREGAIALHSTGKGAADDEITCDTTGGVVKWRLDARMTLGAIGTMESDEVHIGADGPLAAVHFAPVGASGHDVMIMPIRK